MWDPETTATDKVGTFTFAGKVDTYNNDITLTLNVKGKVAAATSPPQSTPIPKENSKAAPTPAPVAAENASGQVGNSADNINYYGFTTTRDGWIYYKNNDNKLHKIRTDGTDKTKLNDDNVAYINAVGSYIYYIFDDPTANKAGYKIKTEGTGKIKLNDTFGGSILVGED